MKSTPDEIRRRFDADVERFSDLEAGHAATLDARLNLHLLTRAAAAATPQARRLLDVGCGAGNYSLKLLQHLPGLDVTLLDLSRPMLDRAETRVRAATTGAVTTVQADVRAYAAGAGQFDIILAAAVLHHLRTAAEWEAVFSAFHAALRPGGGLWIFDMIAHDTPPIEALMRARYADYLVEQGGDAYRDKVFAYVEAEDTPRSLPYQLNLLQQVGFNRIEVLHKNAVFAAFGAVKAPKA
ncbi:MAG: class I SAM-dependent methyltransferase [Anaerolineales bacterium]